MPTIQVRGGDGDVTTTHATLGQRVIISVGSTTGAAIGYTGTPPLVQYQLIVEHMILQ